MDLRELENLSIYIIREAYSEFKNIAVLWSTGKDSTTVLWLARKAFFGKIPFPVIHIDTGYKFKTMYEFRDRIAKEWGLELIVARNEEALGIGPEAGKFECCTKLKTEALKKCLEKYGFDALILAIRRDEHGIRAKERYVSFRDKNFFWNYRNQPPEFWDYFNIFEFKQEGEHLRIHPMLHWTELDMWLYIKKENIPVNPLYFSGTRKKGYRYRSIGCEPCCNPIKSDAKNVDEIIEELKKTKTAERAGRAQDKEKAYMMQKLRALGYM